MEKKKKEKKHVLKFLKKLFSLQLFFGLSFGFAYQR